VPVNIQLLSVVIRGRLLQDYTELELLFTELTRNLNLNLFKFSRNDCQQPHLAQLAYMMYKREYIFFHCILCEYKSAGNIKARIIVCIIYSLILKRREIRIHFKVRNEIFGLHYFQFIEVVFSTKIFNS